MFGPFKNPIASSVCKKALEQVGGTDWFHTIMSTRFSIFVRKYAKLIKFQHDVSNQTKPNQTKSNQTKPNQKKHQNLSSGMPHQYARSSACNFSDSAAHAVSRKTIRGTTIQILDFDSAIWPKTELTGIFVTVGSLYVVYEDGYL